MTNHSSDFSNFYIYQLVVPLITWGSLVGCVLGPLYAPAAWLGWVRCFIVFYCVIGAGHTWRLYCAYGQVANVVALSRKRQQAGDAATEVIVAADESMAADMEQRRPLFTSKIFYHLFIIPNYHEPLELLQGTLEHLAKHTHARNRYMVVLAMEAAEEGHMQKAAQLTEQFQLSFRLMFETSHVKSKDDMGVAANANWAMRQARAKLEAEGYRSKEIVVTKIDADAEVPPLYIDVLDQGLQGAEDPHLLVFGSPVMFERNCDDVPHATRVMDFVWSAMTWQQMCNPEGVGFPISNYSVSMKLLIDIDFLDTNSLAIAEDAHLFLKAFFKTQGRARLHAVFVPLNMVCVKTEQGSWWKDVLARGVQAERHFQGVNDMAYCIKQSLKCGFLGWTHILVFLRTVEANVFPGVIPTYFFLACACMTGILWWTGSGSATLWSSVFTTALLGNVLILNQLLLWLTFDQLRRFCRRELYNLPGQAARVANHVRDVFWMAVDVWVFMYVPHFVACTRAVLPCIEKRYIRGDKAAGSANLARKTEDSIA